MGDDRNEPSVVISQSLAAQTPKRLTRGRGSQADLPGSDRGCFRCSDHRLRSPLRCIAVLSAVAYLMAAPMGRDLSAQMAHAQLAESHWPAVLNLRWYGGFDPLGYSVLSPPVMALVGVRLTTALAYVASAVRGVAAAPAVTRPVAGAIIGAVCLTGNLVTTRTTFALGLALGLGALLAVVSGRAWVASVVCLSSAEQPGSWFIPGSGRRCAVPDRRRGAA